VLQVVLRLSMVSTRKMRNLNKSNAKINEDCSDKDATVVHKSKARVSIYVLCGVLNFLISF
jgi:hypothetical protein